ncbi:MAG TPA: hypothetical protein VNO14_03100 [Blastocatellia bacterium]|nr:hypothetical protein [Blastocatellia bacterium]
MRRKISLTLLVTLTAALAAAAQGCSTGGEPDSDDAYESFTLDLNDPALKERLATDDGYAFAVFYGGDIHGSLETCG